MGLLANQYSLESSFRIANSSLASPWIESESRVWSGFTSAPEAFTPNVLYPPSPQDDGRGLSLFRKIQGHLETIAPALCKTASAYGETHAVHLEDGDVIYLTYSPRMNPEKMVLILPGMASGISSPVVQKAHKMMQELGYSPIVMEFRNCSLAPNNSAKFYNAGSYADLDEVVNHLTETHGHPLKNIIGFSMGGVNLVQWAAKAKNVTARVEKITTIAMPLDMESTANAANTGANKIYQKRMIEQYRHLLGRRHLSCKNTNQILSRLDHVKTAAEFDEKITVPLNGYANLASYYGQNTASQYIRHAQVPYTVINSQNDPLVPVNKAEFMGLGESARMVLLPHGGHLGWLHRKGGAKEFSRYVA